MDFEEITRDFSEIQDTILGLMLFGSRVSGEQTRKSDTDVCVVVGDRNKVKEVWDWVLESGVTEKYDVKIFELLPLKLKVSVMKGKVLWTKDLGELQYYFWKYKRIWDDELLAKKKLGLRIFG